MSLGLSSLYKAGCGKAAVEGSKRLVQWGLNFGGIITMKAKITDRLIKQLKPLERKSYDVCDEVLKGFRLVVRPSGTMTFVFCYRNAEKRWLKYTIGQYGTITTSQARELAKTKSAEVRTGRDIQQEKKDIRKKAELLRQQTLLVFFEEKYEPFLLAERKTGKKIAKQIRSQFIKIWGDKTLTDISPWLISSWRKKKLKTVKPASTNRSLMYLKAMLNKAVEWGVVEINPISNVKQLKEDRKASVRYLTNDEEVRLRSALKLRENKYREARERKIQWCQERSLKAPKKIEADQFVDHLMPMVLIAINTGLRRGEIFDLTIDDVDLDQRILTIRGQKAKSGTTRHIPLNNEACSVIKRWMLLNLDSKLLFPNPKTGNKFDNIKNSWSNILADAGIVDFRFHDLRHTFASKLVMNGVDLYTVKELLGHSTIELTQRYAHLSQDHKMSAVESL